MDERELGMTPVVDRERVGITVLRRAEEGWQSELLEGLGATLAFPKLGVEIPLQRIYERTALLKANPG